jgi:hypothetical protein
MTLIQLFALRFGSGNPTFYGGLGPTFTKWLQMPDGQTLPPPGIFNLGNNPGFYYFTLAVPTFSIAFVCDGGAFLPDAERYIDGLLDPIATAGQRLGYLQDSVGSTSADPTSIFAYLRRSQEVQEGSATFDKSSGVWNVFARGATLLLFQRNFVNSAATVTKS